MMHIQWDLVHTDKLYSQAHQVPVGFAFFWVNEIYSTNAQKQVTIATELRKELLLVQCHSFIFVLELPRAYWAWDLMTDTLTLASSDKRTDKRHRGWEEEEDSQNLGGKLIAIKTAILWDMT